MPEYDVHMVSFKRRGESAYNCLHRGQWVTPWQMSALKKFMDELNVIADPNSAEDLA